MFLRVGHSDHINQIPSSHDHIKQLTLYIIHEKFGLNIQLSVMKPGQASMGLNMHLLVFGDSFDMLRKFGKGQKLVSDVSIGLNVPQHASADLGRESRHVEKVFTSLTMISRKFQDFEKISRF